MTNAEKAAAMADCCGDRLSRDALLQAAQGWRLLAELEDADRLPPARPPHLPSPP